MRPHPVHAAIAGAMFVALAAPCLIHPQSTNEGSRIEIPVLQSTCLISADVRRLVDFYEPILNRKANWSGKDYAEFPTRAGVLAIFSAAAQEKYIPGSAEPATNRSVILEFKVADVDAEYRRL
jgi:glyoxalase/bleomycin resistance protein/dioxygenase superfamily protein